MGKRVTGRFFRNHVLDHGIDSCSYLLTVDVDMTTLPGLPLHELGDGLRRCAVPAGSDTLRVLPWLDKTTLVLCDLFDPTTGDTVEVAPRQILGRQIAARSARRGTRSSVAPSWSSCSSATATRRRKRRGTRPHAAQRVCRGLPRAPDHSDEYLIRAIRNGVDNAGHPGGVLEGRGGLGQHEINLEYAEALEMADRHAIYKNTAKEIAGLDVAIRSRSWRSTTWSGPRLVVPHPLERVGYRRRHHPHARSRRAPRAMSDVFEAGSVGRSP